MLSNLGWLRSFKPPDGSAPCDLRPARDSEVQEAVRLIAAGPGSFSDEQQVKEYLHLAGLHRCDLGGIWVAEQAGRLISAVLPIASPGRTMLLFPPLHVRGEFQERLTRQLIEAVCDRAVAEGIRLAQVLLEVHDSLSFPLVASCSFKRLAELLYLQTQVRQLRPVPTPDGWTWDTYRPETQEAFKAIILESYRQSLDCPALNGMRDIDDIMAGHMATGEFDPKLWFLLREREQALGVLLLSRVARCDVMELVYLGVAPQQRGRGVGDLLMRQALYATATRGCGRLSLAVDAGNLPAIKLYWRHGLQAIGRKMALIRDLRSLKGSLGPALPPGAPGACNQQPVAE
jgi:ribosomal protein S18 acetylase RimI-like enzyme